MNALQYYAVCHGLCMPYGRHIPRQPLRTLPRLITISAYAQIAPGATGRTRSPAGRVRSGVAPLRVSARTAFLVPRKPPGPSHQAPLPYKRPLKTVPVFGIPSPAPSLFAALPGATVRHALCLATRHKARRTFASSFRPVHDFCVRTNRARAPMSDSLPLVAR